MPKRGDKARPGTPQARTGARKRWPRGGPTKAELKKYRARLVELANDILRSSRNLADEALKSAGQDFSVEHMADHGTDNFDQEFSLGLLEGESVIFRAILEAIEKIDGKGEFPYGLCENCAVEQPPEGSPRRCPTCPWIAKGRLEAVPYARLCVVQQELEEEEAGA